MARGRSSSMTGLRAALTYNWREVLSQIGPLELQDVRQRDIASAYQNRAN